MLYKIWGNLNYIPFYVVINSYIIICNETCMPAEDMAKYFGINVDDYIQIMVERYNGGIYITSSGNHYIYFKDLYDVSNAIEYLKSIIIASKLYC